MKHRAMVTIAVAAVVVLGVAGVAFAAPWAPKMGTGMRGSLGLRGLGKATREGTEFTTPAELLDLTDEQVERIQEIQSKASAEIQAIAAEVMAEQSELRSLMWQRNVEQSVLTAKFEEISALKQEMAEVAAKAKQDLLAVLTPEQQATLSEARGLGGLCGKLGLSRQKSGLVRKGL